MEHSSQVFLAVCLLSYAVAAGLALLFQRQERLATTASFGLGTLGATAGLLAAITRLVFDDDRPSFPILPSGVPYIEFTVRLDALGAFFLLIVSLLALSLSIYSLGYARSYFGKKNVGILGAFFNTLLLTTTLVFLADNAFFFLVASRVL
jgi:hydrogenase-4 component B